MPVSDWLAGLAAGTDYGEVHGLVQGTTNLARVTTVRPGQAYYVTVLRPAAWTPPAAGRIENPSDVSFVYDGDGGRVKKVTWRGTTVFLGQSYEVSPEGRPTLYVFAGGQRLAAREADGGLRIYHGDHLGSANVVTDQTGAFVEVTENTPYGSVSRQEGSINVAHKFTGQRLDDETDLYFYNARYYDPEIGRFIQPDPLFQDIREPQMLNHYSYVGNNPLRYVDPSGHFWEFVVAAIVSIAITFAVDYAIAEFGIEGDAAKALRIAAAAASAFFTGNLAGLSGNALSYSTQAAALTSAAMDTGEGRKLVKGFAGELQQMGLGRDAANIVASTLTSAALNSFFYMSLATVNAREASGLDFTKGEDQETALARDRSRAIGKNTKQGGSIAAMIELNGANQSVSRYGLVRSEPAFKNDRLLFIDQWLTGPLNIRHTAVSTGLGDSAAKAIPSYLLQHVCHQASVNQLINAGMGGFSAVGMVAKQAGWSFFLSSSIYGVQGTTLNQQVGLYYGSQLTTEQK
jgi:RHS repeat-associated protein